MPPAARPTRGEKVPISSPDHSHWRESVFDTEVMTPRLDDGRNPISAITIQAMADAGYAVDVSQAEDFELPNTAPPDMAADEPGQVLDLTGDVVRGPVIVVDADGRVVRVIPPPPGTVLPSFRRREVPVDRPGRDGPGAWIRSPSRGDPPGR